MILTVREAYGMIDLVPDPIRSRETLAQIVTASAWQTGGFARSKRVVAARMLALLPEAEDDAFDDIRFLDGMLGQFEEFEADGEAEPIGLTDADVIEEIEKGLAKSRETTARILNELQEELAALRDDEPE
jgi:hypothetical protein